MDATSLIGPAVVAAVISGLVSGIGILLSTRTARAIHTEKLAFDREQAERKMTADIELGERKLTADIALAARKFEYDRDLDAWKRRTSLAEEVLADFYQAKDIIDAARSPGSLGGESDTPVAAAMRLASGMPSRKLSPASSRATRANSLQVLSPSSAPSFSVAAVQAQRSAQNVRLAGSSCVETASIRRLRVLRGRNRSSTASPASNQVATVSYFCSHLADARCALCVAAVLVRSGGSSASSASTIAKGEVLSG
jgi:hypothetical protein